MENIVLILGILLLACILSCAVLLFKIKGETLDTPAVVRFFGFQVFFDKYLTEKGRTYKYWYWRIFFLVFVFVFVFAALAVALMYFMVPEFR